MDVHTRVEAKTDPSYGKRPEERSIEELLKYGIVVIDKPAGPTSHQVSEYLQRILTIQKAGHSGTLDPAVTGVLPIALGRATRLTQALLKSPKAYVGVMHLHDPVDEKELMAGLEAFTGRIEQLPPLKSAVKRRPRKRTVYSFDILEKDGKDILFHVSCEAGTYIRKLVHDLGEHLSVGAHMAQLRRVKAGPFTEEGMVTLQDLTDAYHYWAEEGDGAPLQRCLYPMEMAVQNLPKIWAHDYSVESLCHGVSLKVPGVVRLTHIEPDQLVAVMSLKDELIALGRAKMATNKILEAEKGVVVDVSKVFMEPGTYPRPSAQ